MEKINSRLINLNLKADTWEEALMKGGGVLLEEGYIEDRYIKTLIEITKKEGPYYIITKGIAIPHVRPDEGVKKTGFSFIRLEKGVNFGSKENDPVKYIIFLMSKTSEEHIDLINLIISIIEDREFFRLVEENSGNNQENIRIIENYINRMGECLS